MRNERMYYSFNLIKTYTNGTTYRTKAHMDRVNVTKEKIDAEDRKAGLSGEWTVYLI